jgi:hypothetical protein
MARGKKEKKRKDVGDVLRTLVKVDFKCVKKNQQLQFL